MKKELHTTRNNIDSLNNLPDVSYENMFRVYIDDNYYAYNVIRSIKVPADLGEEFFTYNRISGNLTWTQLSMRIYGTIRLWWLLCVTNKIMNPVILPKAGLVIKVIKPEYIKDIMTAIHKQI